MASTPPPPSPSELRVPRAPRHGAKHDNYEPYPTRYSARLAVQRASRAVQTTPPPSHQNASAKPGASKRNLSPSSPGTAKPSSRKTARSHRTAASRISPFESELSLPRTSSHNPSSAEQALPTPAKTPSKKKVVSSDSSISRSLFPSTSTPKRRKMDTTKPSATDSPAIFVDEPLIGYNIQAAEQELGIPIHEDSRDRIPVIGPLSTDSIIPRPARAGVRPATRSNSRPNEGVYYVHRGKKIFQRFDDIEDEGEDEDDLGLFANRPDLLANNPDILKSVKPLRRADIKPRILFPLDVAPTNGGEEDVTDVEDHDDHEPMSPTPANEDEARLTPPILPDPATSESESLSFTPCAPVGYPGIVTQSAPVKHAGLHFTRSTPIEHTGRHFTRSTVGNVPPFQPDSFSEDLGFDTPADDQTRSRGLSTSSGSSLLKYWPPVSRKARGPEAPADRVKRLREARGSPAPRTRRAVRAEASGESSTAKPSTSDS